MALSPITPRDRVQRLGDLGKKTMRYWWLVAVFAVVGGGLSLAFAMFKPKAYQSWATLFYQEQIQTQLMTPNREEVAQRNIGDRYRELLLARAQLEQIISDPKLDPYPNLDDNEVKIDKLRQAIKFEGRGANAFRITYNDSDPDRAKAIAGRLTELLQAKDKDLRNEIAQATVTFATEQKETASASLRKTEQALAEFLAQHPEFAQDANNANAEGASIRAIRDAKKTQTGNNRLYALERQRQRIQARLTANPDEPPVRTVAPPSPERIAAQANADEAKRELASAQRDVEEAKTRYTEKHPTVIKAQERVAAAQLRLRQALAAVPPEIETTVAPATPQDRAKLEKELAQLEAQISGEQKKTAGAAPVVDNTTNWVVQLETQHADLRRAVAEQRERVESLADSVFRAQIDASQKLAEQGGRLSVVDPAFKPIKPTGPGKTIFLLGGMVLFLTLGTALAVGMAVIDDRVYRRADLDQLGIRVLAVIPKARTIHRREATRKEAA
jgi:uncharacterized protein involved in exopolysaccharide biosynthesis